MMKLNCYKEQILRRRCVAAIDTKEIYGFEIGVLKRFVCKALVSRDFVI